MQTQRGSWKAPFYTIWSVQQISYLGSMLAGFALVWWVTEATGSATKLATLTLLQILPGILLGPFAGALVDRVNRRVVMIVADGIVALLSAWLAYQFWAGALQMWQVYVVMVARALGGTFHWPAMSASTSLMVPKEQLSRVAGLNQTIGGIWNIVSPPLGALLISVMPLYSVMAIDVITAAIAIAPLFFVAIPQPARRPSPATEDGAVTSLLRDMRDGMAYVWRWPGLMALLVMATVINLVLNPAFSLMPLLVNRHFGRGALELGWMNSVWGVGVVVGGLLLSVWGGFKRRILTSITGIFLLGMATLTIGVTPVALFGVALGAMAVTGFANPLTNGPFFAICQSVVPPEMQGRVLTLITSACSAMSPLGLAIAGRVADRFGVNAWFVIGGVVCLAMSVGSCLVPPLMMIESNHAPTVAAEEGPVVERRGMASAAEAD